MPAEGAKAPWKEVVKEVEGVVTVFVRSVGDIAVSMRLVFRNWIVDKRTIYILILPDFFQ